MVKFKAYLEDFDFILVEEFECRDLDNIVFILYDGISFVPLYQEAIENLGDIKRYHLKTTEDLDVSKKYTIYTEDGDYALLEKRGVVLTKKFDEKFYYDGPLGNVYTPQGVDFYVWSPIAENVLLVLYYPRTESILKTYTMYRINSCVWHVHVDGDYEGYSYNYYVENNDKIQIAQDPYADSATSNNNASYIIDQEKIKADLKYKSSVKFINSIIYETSIRDFTSDIKQSFSEKGYYNRFTQTGAVNGFNDKIGFDYLTSLGITHLQVMPVQFFGNIDEYNGFKNYNWGYDTMHHNVVTGYYSSDSYDPYTRIYELKAMIKKIQNKDIGVIFDVVYNHVFRRDKFCYEKIMPYYFYRFDDAYNYSDGTGVGNDIASERKMVRRYIIDSVKRLVNNYGVDGFRFDLMGILDIETLNQIRKMLDGFDKNIYMYGEGWNLNTRLRNEDKGTTENAQLMPNIGFFNGFFRDKVVGSVFDYKDLGIATSDKKYYDSITNILLGYTPNILMDTNQVINFISVHDNLTLNDRYKKNFNYNSIIHNVKNSFNLLLSAQGTVFIHSGSEFLRTKQGIADSYNKSDQINMLDWRLVTANKNVVEYVKKLIKLRKYLADYIIGSRSEIGLSCKVTVKENLVIYKINKKNGLTVYINLGYEKVYLSSDMCHGECVMINNTLDYDNKIKLDDIMIIEPASIAVFEL